MATDSISFLLRCCVISVLCLITSTITSGAAKPNIVLIFADDLGWGDISLHGHPDIRTPNIDRLAREGAEFHQFTVSNPVCSPSRTAVMTGQYPARHSVHRHFASVEHHERFSMPDWLNPDVLTVADVLKGAGYKTGHFGKWHLTNSHVRDAPPPSEYGFDESAVFNGPGPQTDAFRLYDDAIDFIRRHQDEPFFVNLWIHETHTPHYPEPESLEKYAHLDEQLQTYAAVVDAADRRIGKVLDALDELALTENTLVVFSSDNGPEITGPAARKLNPPDPDAKVDGIAGLGTWYSVGSTAGLRGRKRDTYEGGIRTPFLVRWPAQVPAGRVDTGSVVTAVDLLPTFAAAAGAKLPAEFGPDGQNVLALFQGRSMERDKPIYWEWRFGSTQAGHPEPPSLLAVREGPWKLFHHGAETAPELYNVVTDRNESHDVSADHPSLAKRLTAKVVAWKDSLPSAPPAHCISKRR